MLKHYTVCSDELTSLSSMEKERKRHPSLCWQRQSISEIPQGPAAVLTAYLQCFGFLY